MPKVLVNRSIRMGTGSKGREYKPSPHPYGMTEVELSSWFVEGLKKDGSIVILEDKVREVRVNVEVQLDEVSPDKEYELDEEIYSLE